jgi:hypothetical protein
MRKSFCRLCCLVFFCWCLSYKSPRVISQHDSVTFVTASYVHSGYILMEPSTVLVRDGSHISRAKIQLRLHEMKFQRHVVPQGAL